ncbi:MULTISPECIES: fumarylacetoacetate hydrolase family protein [unclassified Endozoicomonas]|uniref:fumarylacetoacetate hydrolase family protein n=2 Tax=Endozoicomonas TaxID=305899 RepID=UPI002147EE58|nr:MULTISPECIES: fumarylacetoacetate hydrolase family protein [unclassified Endozoicomonas]
MFPIISQKPSDYAVGKIICVGRNYLEHVKELDNDISTSPLLFIKPLSSVVPFAGSLNIPEDFGVVHHELEISILIGEAKAPKSYSIRGVGLALDLTLRDLQNELKKQGHPWERAKAFSGSAVISDFIEIDDYSDLDHLKLILYKNNKLQQRGNSGQMIFKIEDLLYDIDRAFTLQAGDIVLTGTPAGVSSLSGGDQLIAELYVRNRCELKTSASIA